MDPRNMIPGSDLFEQSKTQDYHCYAASYYRN